MLVEPKLEWAIKKIASGIAKQERRKKLKWWARFLVLAFTIGLAGGFAGVGVSLYVGAPLSYQRPLGAVMFFYNILVMWFVLRAAKEW